MRLSPLVALSVVSLLAAPAFAEDKPIKPAKPGDKQVGPDDPDREKPVGGAPVPGEAPPQEEYQSPQHFALELKAGPYVPGIDSTPGLTGLPFSELFNNQYDSNKLGQPPAAKPQFTVEFDYQFLRKGGSLGLAASAGFYRRSTHAFEYSDPVAHTPCAPAAMTCKRSTDETALTIFPLTLELVYRFDVLAKRYKIPIVPYLKGGIAYYFWFVQKGDSSLSQSLPDASGNTSKAIGGTLGWVAHPGVALLLDVFDPSAARTMDADLGINHTYLFAELNYANITGLGFKDKMVFSDTTWNVGVAFEF